MMNKFWFLTGTSLKKKLKSKWFIIVNILSMIAVLFIPLQWIITGDLLFAIVETLGISKELEKEEKKQALSEEIGNLKSQLMWEPNDEIAEYCAKRTIEYKLGNQYYTLPQLEKEETRVIENNEKENVIDKKIGIGKEQIKTYDLKVIKNR